MLEEDANTAESQAAALFSRYSTLTESTDFISTMKTVNTVFGGILDAQKAIAAVDTVTYNGEAVSIVNQNTLRTGISDCLKLTNYDSSKPDASIPLIKTWNAIKYDFTRNFIHNNQWKYLANGLLTTLEITFLAVLLGIVIGFLVAVIRCTNQRPASLRSFRRYARYTFRL